MKCLVADGIVCLAEGCPTCTMVQNCPLAFTTTGRAVRRPRQQPFRAIHLGISILLLLISSAVSVLAQTVTLLPTSLSFGNQALSATSAAKNVTLKNGQSGALTISSITASGDYADTTTCGASLAAGASCTISVTFTPTATGSRTGTLTVTDSGSNSPQTVSLTGTGVLQATLTPASLSFGSQAVATSSVTNNRELICRWTKMLP
jgi:hypothetical protein